MLKQLNRADLDLLLTQISDEYRLQVPQLLADGTRQLAGYTGEAELSLTGEVLQRKPSAFFFPQTQRLLDIDTAGAVAVPQPAEKPLALFGLNQADLAGIRFLDRFFRAAPADDAYLRQRNGALLIGLTGMAGPDNCFLSLSAGDCDIELVAVKESWLALGHSSDGEKLLQNFPEGDKTQLVRMRHLNEGTAAESDLLQQASQLLIEDRVPDQFWMEIADRCILCSGCNLVCPTCSCFCVQDRNRGEITERSRVWDSCQLDAFMREASGHNPLGTDALRTRRRIHHKLAADVERWGEFGCVACGRCDRTCPTGIGMMAVAEEMVKCFGPGKP